MIPAKLHTAGLRTGVDQRRYERLVDALGSENVTIPGPPGRIEMDGCAAATGPVETDAVDSVVSSPIDWAVNVKVYG